MKKTIRAVSPDPIDNDVMIGETIDGYRIKRRIASGGMGVVYEAFHENLGRKYAIKMLHSHLIGNRQIVSRFVAEGQRTNQIDIDGVVAVHHVGRTSGDVPFLVMDYIDGETLAAYRQRLFGKPDRGLFRKASGPRATPDTGVVLNALRLTRQLAQTLCLIHEQGVVHRDLKPDNIFVVRDACVSGGNRVKILDFGIAKAIGANQLAAGGQAFPWAPTIEPTIRGTTMGTPTYMPPEQWETNGTVHPKSDVYACGVIFYELMNGSPPFSAKYIGQLMEQHKTQCPTSLRTVVPWVPASFSALVDAMLRKNLQERPDMPQVLSTLDEILRQQLALLNGAPARSSSGVQTLFDGLFLSSWGTSRPLAGAASAVGVGASGGATGPDLVPWRRQQTRLWAVGFSICGLLLLLGLSQLSTAGLHRRANKPGDDPAKLPGEEAFARDFVVNTEPPGASVYLSPESGESLDGVMWPRCIATPCTLLKDELRGDVRLLIVKEKYRGVRLTPDAVRRDNYQILLRLLPLQAERLRPPRRPGPSRKPEKPAASLPGPAQLRSWARRAGG